MESSSCPICEKSSLISRGQYKGKTLRECQNCGAQFWYPVEYAGAEFYETSDVYSIVKRNPSWYHRQFLGHPPVKAGRLLEIGCGQGEFLEAALKMGFDAHGIDVAPRNIEFIKKRRGIDKVTCGRVEEHVDELGVFDIVTLFEVIEHVESPLALLAAIKKMLRPGGYLILSTPNLRRIGSTNEAWDYPPNHLSKWDSDSLSYLLWRAGFTVEAMKEQVIGRDCLLMSGASSLGIVRRLKAALRKNPAYNTAGVPSFSPSGTDDVNGRRRKLKIVERLANIKNAVFLVIVSPLILIGKIFRVKYWDLYVVAKSA